MTAIAIALLGAAALPLASAYNVCYDYYGGSYYCNGLGYGARIGIGVGVAVGVLLLLSLCMFWRRRNVRNQWNKFRPPALPTQNSYGNNQYANNPPPPQGYYGQQSSFNGNPYGNGPNPPPQTYQPSMAGAYGGYGNREMSSQNVNKPETTGEGDHEHGYEWQQAREAERNEREQGGLDAPPGYNVSAATTPQNTGGYAPPPGAPPK